MYERSIYTSELQEILHTGLASFIPAMEVKDFLPNAAIMLFTKMVASLIGYVRCLFEVLRGDIDMAVRASTSRSNENPLNTPGLVDQVCVNRRNFGVDNSPNCQTT